MRIQATVQKKKNRRKRFLEANEKQTSPLMSPLRGLSGPAAAGRRSPVAAFLSLGSEASGSRGYVSVSVLSALAHVISPARYKARCGTKHPPPQTRSVCYCGLLRNLFLAQVLAKFFRLPLRWSGVNPSGGTKGPFWLLETDPLCWSSTQLGQESLAAWLADSGGLRARAQMRSCRFTADSDQLLANSFSQLASFLLV